MSPKRCHIIQMLWLQVSGDPGNTLESTLSPLAMEYKLSRYRIQNASSKMLLSLNSDASDMDGSEVILEEEEDEEEKRSNGNHTTVDPLFYNPLTLDHLAYKTTNFGPKVLFCVQLSL